MFSIIKVLIEIDLFSFINFDEDIVLSLVNIVVSELTDVRLGISNDSSYQISTASIDMEPGSLYFPLNG